MEDKRRHNHVQLPEQRNPPHMMEVEWEVDQALACEGSVAEEDAVAVGTFAYIVCHCMATGPRLERPRRLCCA